MCLRHASPELEPRSSFCQTRESRNWMSGEIGARSSWQNNGRSTALQCECENRWNFCVCRCQREIGRDGSLFPLWWARTCPSPVADERAWQTSLCLPWVRNATEFILVVVGWSHEPVSMQEASDFTLDHSNATLTLKSPPRVHTDCPAQKRLQHRCLFHFSFSH